MTIDATQTVEETVPKPIPDRVNIFEGREEVPDLPPEITPETVQADESILEKLPTPTGYRLLILPFSQKTVTKGGIHLAESYVEKERLSTNVGFVVSVGPDAYMDYAKFPGGAWCKEKDWVIFGRYAGARIKIDGGDLRLLNDDEVLAVINNPEDVQ
jgi:co-chaperonin GroES (HSP10)